jgi:hypothetical protein
MKKLLSFLFVGVVLFVFTGVSYGEIGWAGQIWPNHDHTVPEIPDLDVYLQIWKGGVTDGAGQGAGIGASLFYGPNGGPYTEVAMTYNADIGNNDEYKGVIPWSALEGQTEIWFYCEAYDSTDASTYTGAQDQNGHVPPHKLNITPVLNHTVTVIFYMCLPPEGHPDYDPDPGEVCITGSHAELTSWGNGVQMMQECPTEAPQRYWVGIDFLQGSSPYLEYKYRKNGCETWESGANHTLFIDDDYDLIYLPYTDHFSWYEGECGECVVPVDAMSWGAIKTIYR